MIRKSTPRRSGRRGGEEGVNSKKNAVKKEIA